MATKIRLPQLNAESLKGDLTFKESGANASNQYLKFDLGNNKIEIGSANKGIELDGALSGDSFQDDDTFGSPSASKVASSESIKAYVDNTTAAMDLDITVDGGSAIDALLNSEVLNFVSGEGIDLAASGLDITISAEDAVAGAGSANKGVASFESSDFGVSSGHVSLVDLTVPHFAAASIVTEAEGLASSDNDTSLPTTAAVKKYADDQDAAQDLDITADSGSAAVLLNSQQLAVSGTANEIVTSASGQGVTIGLPDDVIVSNDLTVLGDLHVEGTRILANAEEVVISDHRMEMGVPFGMIDASKITHHATSGSTVSLRIPLDACAALGTNSGGTAISNSNLSGVYANNQHISFRDERHIYIKSTSKAGNTFVDKVEGYLIKNGGVTFPAQNTVQLEIESLDNSFAAVTAAGYTDNSGNSLDTLSISAGVLLSETQDGAGLVFPASGLSGGRNTMFTYSTAIDAMVNKGSGLFVDHGTGNPLGIDGATTASKLGFRNHSGGAGEVMFQPAGAVANQGSKSIKVPVENGTLAVNATASTGIALDAVSGLLAINIDGATDYTPNGSNITIADTDKMLISDNGTEGMVQMDQVKAYISSGGTTKSVGNLTGQITAGTLVSNTNGFPNLGSAPLSIINGASAPESQHEIYVNGLLMVRAQDAAFSSLQGDYGYRTDGAQQGLCFTFDLEADDIVQIVLR